MGCGIANFGRWRRESKPLPPWVQTPSCAASPNPWGQDFIPIFSVWVVSRPLRPIWAIPHPIISQNMRFCKRKKNVNHPFNMASWMSFGSLLSRWYWGVEKFFVKVESFDVFIQECKISSIDFCTECQNFTIQSQPNGGEIWMSSNFLEQKKDDNRLFKIS